MPLAAAAVQGPPMESADAASTEEESYKAEQAQTNERTEGVTSGRGAVVEDEKRATAAPGDAPAGKAVMQEEEEEEEELTMCADACNELEDALDNL